MGRANTVHAETLEGYIQSQIPIINAETARKQNKKDRLSNSKLVKLCHKRNTTS